MTGEITLRGRVLRSAAAREVLAASGNQTVIIPSEREDLWTCEAGEKDLRFCPSSWTWLEIAFEEVVTSAEPRSRRGGGWFVK